MWLEDIGFYTLSDKRAKESSSSSPLYRCELLLTSRCNFHCPYCRGLKGAEDLPFNKAERILKYWISEDLQNIRFSGGEPILYEKLPQLVRIAKRGGVKHIAVSTNGSGGADLYKRLIECGVNDFSVSLDACCANTGAIMSGRKNVWGQVLKNIELLSSLTYVSAGIVLNDKNKEEASKIVMLAHKLGVKDIRVIPSAQFNRKLRLEIPDSVSQAHPILKYRLTNNRHVRGLNWLDSKKCKLVLDDMAVWNGEHYPCIIYLREGGKAIGNMNSRRVRLDRFDWYINHNSWTDPICHKNCLDVCIAFNNCARKEIDER